MKKIFLILFSLILMCSVSFAYDVIPNTTYSWHQKDYNVSSTTFLDTTYTRDQVYNILKNIYNDKTNENYIDSFNTLTEEMDSLGYKWIVLDKGNELSLYSSWKYDVAFGVKQRTSPSDGSISYYYGVIGTKITSSSEEFCYEISSTNTYRYHTISSAAVGKNAWNSFVSPSTEYEVYAANTPIYLGIPDTEGTFTWDGASYYYQPSSGSTTQFTDEQIAEIVERFINSEAYFGDVFGDDYFITYDNLTGYFRGYSYDSSIDLAIEYGNYDEEGNFVTTGTKEGEAWQIRPYIFEGNVFNKFSDWLSSKFNIYSFRCYSISPDNSIEPRWLYDLQYNYCSNYVENEVVIYTTKQIRYVGEETDEEGKTETVITDNYIPPTILIDSETGEEIIIRDNLQDSSNNLENIITPNADFSGLKQAFEKYISFVNISSITWLTTAISSMITIFVPFVALGIIIFLINRILNGGS